MNIYSYIIAHDTGFSPNPFHGHCTLACCKPVIRRCAEVGDWVVGLTPRRLGHRIVFAMRISEKLTFAQYWPDPRFWAKRPRLRGRDPKLRVGDNIYQPIAGGEFRQRPSRHSKPDGREDPKAKKHDLGGEFVLVAKRFSYFGKDALPLPKQLQALVAGRGHRRVEARASDRIVRVLEKLPRGIRGKPRGWVEAVTATYVLLTTAGTHSSARPSWAFARRLSSRTARTRPGHPHRR